MYGSSEVGRIADERIGDGTPGGNIFSVGKLKPGIQLKVVDMETKKSLGPNKVGEFWLKSDLMMKCYVGDPDSTNEAIDKDGWLHTGDLGYYDDNENLYVVDRVKELFICKDFLVSCDFSFR